MERHEFEPGDKLFIVLPEVTESKATEVIFICYAALGSKSVGVVPKAYAGMRDRSHCVHIDRLGLTEEEAIQRHQSHGHLVVPRFKMYANE